MYELIFDLELRSHEIDKYVNHNVLDSKTLVF